MYDASTHELNKQVLLKLLRLSSSVNTSRPRRNGRHFADDIFKHIFFLNENDLISINILLKFIPNGPIDSISALVQMMWWRQPFFWTNGG